jgi:hypothetical protein
MLSKVPPCLFCHCTSWEQKREHALGLKKYQTLQADSMKETGLLCCHCGSFFCKPCLAALLQQALNNRVLKTYENGRLCYPPPLSKELYHLSLAEAQCTGSKSKLLDALVLLNKHTLVASPVGYHIDVFADQEPSLENRICFVHSKKGQAVSRPAQGRGGA